ncbi:MAG: hypothetical protein WC309_04010, partial [Candidatus Paceibacterota bacterium]
MKYKQFVEVADTNNNLEDLTVTHNLGYYNSKYYWVEIGSGLDDNIYIKSATSITSATTTEYTYDMRDIAFIGAGGFISITGYGLKIFYVNSKWVLYAVVSGYRGADAFTFAITNNFTDALGFTEDVYGSAGWITVDVGAMYLYGIYTVGTQDVSAVINYSYEGSLMLGFIHSYISGASYGEIHTTLAIEYGDELKQFYPGYTDNGYYYFGLFEDAAFRVYKITSADVLTEDEVIAGLVEPADYEVSSQLFWKQGNYRYRIDSDHFYICEEDWSSFSDSGTSTECVIWDYDDSHNLKINYIIWKDGIYWINPHGLPLRIQSTDEECYVGWGDWFSNSEDKIFQLDSVTYSAVECSIKNTLYSPPSALIRVLSEPEFDTYLILQDNSENAIFEGFILSYETNTEEYVLEMKSGVDYDYQRKLDVDFTDKTAHYILKYVIDNYCSYIWYDSGISTTPATEYTISFKGKSVLDVMKWADKKEGYITSIRQDNEVYWDQYSDSLLSITTSTFPPQLKTQTLKFSKITLYGANGLVSTYLGEPNFGEFIDWFPEIDNQTDLDAAAAQMGSDMNINLSKIKLGSIAVGMFDYGTSVTLTSALYSITAETWYIIEVDYDALTDQCSLMLTDAYWSPSNNNIDDKPTQNEQAIGMISEHVNNLTIADITDLTFGIANTNAVKDR